MYGRNGKKTTTHLLKMLDVLLVGDLLGSSRWVWGICLGRFLGHVRVDFERILDSVREGC